MKNKSTTRVVDSLYLGGPLSGPLYATSLTIVLDRAITVHHRCRTVKKTDPAPELIFVEFLVVQCTNCKQLSRLTEAEWQEMSRRDEEQEKVLGKQRARMDKLRAELLDSAIEKALGVDHHPI